MSYQQTEERAELTGILAEFREALEEEIDKIKKSGQSSTLLFAGRQIESNGPEQWYKFNVEYLPVLPADTPCKLTVGKEQYDVTVISCEESTIIVSAKSSLPDTIGRARLENGATVLMERLIKRIEAESDKANPAGDRMLIPDGNVYKPQRVFSYNDLALSENNTAAQNKAIESALSNDITYIWGPPGTGKTTVIGQIIDELYKHNRSVLVVSHTNTAVDGAIEKADKTYSATHTTVTENYPILRIGTPARPLPERVLLASHVDVLGKDLYEQQKAIEEQQALLHKRINEILPLLSKSVWLASSKLAEIQDIFNSIEDRKRKINCIKADIEDMTSSIKHEKGINPEIEKYCATVESIKQKKAIYDTICAQVAKAEKAIRELPLLIQNADEEIRKHDVHADLCEQETKFMPAQFYKAEISKCDILITAKSSEITSLNLRQKAAKQTVEEYEKKGSMAKLFAGKAAINQAHETLRNISISLPKANEELQRQKLLRQEYAQQLEKLLLIQEQIKAVTPTELRYFWVLKSQQLQNDLTAANASLPGFSAKKNTLYEEICELEQIERNTRAAYDRVSKMEKQLKVEEAHLREHEEELKRTNYHLESLLSDECIFCHAFHYSPVSADANDLFEELQRLFAMVKTEMAGIDTVVLKQEKDDADNKLVELYEQLNELKLKMQELERQAILNAKIVGATLAKSYLSDTLRERSFDTVILDEASMASIPALWCASRLSDKSIVIVGDFLQLPPIVMAETEMAQKWLGKDVFCHSGMQEKAKNRTTCPENFVMLNDQFRMESDIADVANMYYGAYGGLRSDDTSAQRQEARNEFYGWYSGKKTKHNIHLIDTENLHAWVTGVPQGKSHSRLNCFSAAVDVDLAFKCLENKLNALDPATAAPAKEASVLIVAPYKPHIARINQLIELEYRNRGFDENLNLIRAGTIHSFQGSEADIVIFDLVIDEPHE